MSNELRDLSDVGAPDMLDKLHGDAYEIKQRLEWIDCRLLNIFELLEDHFGGPEDQEGG